MDPLPDIIHERFASTLERASTYAEFLALKWCLDHYFLFVEHAAGGYPWVLTAYERLVTEGIDELQRITTALGVEETTTMRERLGVPSGTVFQSRLRRKPEEQLAKWKKRLTPKQIDEILRIVEAFGLDFYTDDLQPDYSRLMQFQREEAQPQVASV